MSIHVTVKGNPIKINRGKLITNGESNEEFEKRRKMRLQQVRQQSNEIAESVRNRVKQEKSKQLSSLEQEGVTKLKQWQNRKLLELQNQYEECLNDIGLGHTQAQLEEDEELTLQDQERFNRERANERGRLAKEISQIEQNEKSLQKSVPEQNKKFARDVENIRASLVAKSSINKKITPKKSKKAMKENQKLDEFSVRSLKETITPDKSSQRRIPNRSPPRQSIPSIRASKSPVKTAISAPKSPLKTFQSNIQKTNNDEQNDAFTSSEDRPKSPIMPSKVPKQPSAESDVSFLSVEVPLDTRISDRIKNRHLGPSLNTHPSKNRMSDIQEASSSSISIKNASLGKTKTEKTKESDYHNEMTSANHIACHCHIQQPFCDHFQHASSKNTTCKDTISKESKATICNATSDTCFHPKNISHTQLPTHPTVSLKEDSNFDLPCQRQYKTVKCYDHKNKYTKDYLVDTSDVRKVCPDSIEQFRNDEQFRNNEEQFRNEQDEELRIFNEAERERLTMANERGRQAMERNKIRKEYDTLLRQLPLLQRKERIARLNPEKDKLHMSETRRKEFEKIKQNRIENAFEKLVPKRITIPSRRSPSPEGREKIEEREKRMKSPLGRKSVEKSHEETKSKILAAKKEEKSHKAKDLHSKSPKKRKDVRSRSPKSKFESENSPKKDSKATKVLAKQKQSESKENKDPTLSGDETDELNLYYLIKKLKKQKELLLKETKDLPENSNFYNLMDELDFVCKSSSSSDKNENETTKTRKTICGLPKCERKFEEKRKRKRNVLILQNTSTQTSPKVTSNTGNQVNDSIIIQESGIQKGEHSDIPKVVFKTKDETKTKDTKSSSKANGTLKSKDERIVVCECSSENSEKLCEILIKIQDDETPQVIIRNRHEESDNKAQKDNNIAEKHKTLREKGQNNKSPLRKQQTDTIHEPRSPEAKKTKYSYDQTDNQIHITDNQTRRDYQTVSSWKETLSTEKPKQRSNISIETSSTSYYSPPNYNHIKSKLQERKRQIIQEKSKTDQKKFDPRLIKFIKRLLEMPKQVLDDLGGLSTVSEVSTPSSSIINIPTNLSNQTGKSESLKNSKLMKILEAFNLTFEDLTNGNFTSLTTGNISSSSASKHSSSSASTKNSTSSSERSVSNGNLNGKGLGTVVDFANSTSTQTHLNESIAIDGNAQMAQQFTKWAEVYQERINNLANLIEKVRMEKQQILSSPQSLTSSSSNSDKENITSYLKLPDTVTEGSSSPEQKELTKQQLSVNIGTENLAQNIETQTASDRNDLAKLDLLKQDEIDKDIVVSYLKLLEVELKSQKAMKDEKIEVPDAALVSRTKGKDEKALGKKVVVESKKVVVEGKKAVVEEEVQQQTGLEFTPMLDIPKLPKLTAPIQIISNIITSSGSTTKKPPVSTNALRFNEVVHELSMIPEAESSRFSKSPSKGDPSPFKSNDHSLEDGTKKSSKNRGKINSEKQPEAADIAKSSKSFPSPILKSPERKSEPKSPKTVLISTEKTSPNIPIEVEHVVKRFGDTSSESSSSNSGQQVDLESMLKQIGIDWGISALKKSANNTSGGGKKSLPTPATSTPSASSFTEESNKLNVLVAQSLSSDSSQNGSHEGKRLQRTSTPIQTTNSSSKRSNKFISSGESEISPVNNNNGRSFSKAASTFNTLPGEGDEGDEENSD